MATVIRLFLFTTGLFFTFSACAQNPRPDWQKIKDEDGILVYSAAVNDSDIIKVKTEVIIDAPLTRIRQILDDAPRRKQWVPYLERSKVLQRISNTERLEYSHFDAPWPASDRDFVYRIRLQHKQNNQLVFQMRSEQSPLMPEQAGIVRADLIESAYTLTALQPKKTRVELVFHADLKGWLPDWVINIVQRHLPFLMLKNLRTRATITLNKQR
ncbi:hypothetical protein MNBD_GAMMA24-1825 [hydrothermal vent metagenome]|uniref:START domain-containing protein n=1 Tax=hydrothermal vent metagenome TaxID=652676 RepID=A0A3B1C192_9ZZZZ